MAYMGNERDIPRLPTPPPLNERLIAQLTSLIYRNDDPPSPTDIIFVFGTSRSVERCAATVRGLLNAGVASTVVISGGVPRYADSNKTVETPESATILRAIGPAARPDVAFLMETRSWNTRDNVAFAIEDHPSIAAARDIAFVVPAHGGGRGYLTLRKFFPTARLLQHTYSSPLHDGTPIDRSMWYETETGRRRIWGEYLRIKEYGEKGDIATEEIQELLRSIDACTA